jgi:hypothetical protein
MLPERTTGSCRAKRGTAVGDLLTSPSLHADTPSNSYAAGFPIASRFDVVPHSEQTP